MRSFFIDLTLLSLLCVLACWPAPPSEPSTLGVFVGTSPCDAVSRKLLHIPTTGDCEMIKWNLTLYQDPGTLTPTTYELNFTYGMSQPNTNDVRNGGTRAEQKGRWTIARGTKTDPDAVIYKLATERSDEPLSWLRLDHNLLHLLDSDRLAVGNAGWSYTLSSTENFRQQTHPANAATTFSPQKRSLTEVSSSQASSVLGRFVGRSPCVDVARELDKPAEPGCMKVKWDLTLYQDAKTRAPTTYKLRGTLYRDRDKKGTFTILRGTSVNPDAVVYQLDGDASQGSLLFFKADESILFFLDRSRHLMVGNRDFSYTLNREK